LSNAKSANRRLSLAFPSSNWRRRRINRHAGP
jgi:hypothetical protein